MRYEETFKRLVIIYCLKHLDSEFVYLDTKYEAMKRCGYDLPKEDHEAYFHIVSDEKLFNRDYLGYLNESMDTIIKTIKEKRKKYEENLIEELGAILNIEEALKCPHCDKDSTVEEWERKSNDKYDVENDCEDGMILSLRKESIDGYYFCCPKCLSEVCGETLGRTLGIIKAHEGLALMPDEVPIIAQTGEGVLSRLGMDALGGKSQLDNLNKGEAVPNNETHKHYYINAMDAQSFRDFLNNNKESLEDVLTDSFDENSALRRL